MQEARREQTHRRQDGNLDDERGIDSGGTWLCVRALRSATPTAVPTLDHASGFALSSAPGVGLWLAGNSGLGRRSGLVPS